MRLTEAQCCVILTFLHFSHPWQSIYRRSIFTPLLHANNMDLHSALPCATIFHELQTVHDTGFFYSLPSLEDDWAQVCFFVQEFSYQFVLWSLKHACGLSNDGLRRLVARQSTHTSHLFCFVNQPCLLHFVVLVYFIFALEGYCPRTISCVLFSLPRRGSKWIVIFVQNRLLWTAKTQI